MTTDEVVLRRDKASANGEKYAQPPPRLRGQSTYLALLSSLATDLDVMLNDLRASGSSRLIPTTHNRNDESTAAQATSKFSNSNYTRHTTTTTTTAATRSYQYATTSSTTSTCSSSSTSTNSSTSLLAQKQRAAQQNSRLSPNEESNNKWLRVRNTNFTNNYNTKSGNSSPNSNNKIYNNNNNNKNNKQYVNTQRVGLSPEVRQVQKLPLRQKLLQHQPQKVQVQLLQRQQRATKSIAATQPVPVPVMQTKGAVSGTTISKGSHRRIDGVTDITMSSKTVTTTAAKYEFEHKSALATTTTTTATRLDSSGNSNWLRSSSKRYHGLQREPNANRSSDPSGHATTNGQNQLKSTANGATTAINKQCGNNVVTTVNADNHRRLPFCGLDSIKGSDINEDGGEGGKTNLSFDLNVPTNNCSGVAGTALDVANSEQFHSLDANESSCCGDGQFEDDMQALLPKCNHLSRDELSQSRTSLVSSSDGGILAAGETSSETSHDTDDSPPCSMGLVERLLLTHPVWFLPGIQRSGAVHFLQGKEEGNFIVRGSSQPNTMAVSVRLPPDTGPYIEHYLIQSNDGVLSLESSRFKFDAIPTLIAHYAQCCDELPVQLVLPRALRDAKNRQQLSSLALLGQEFWRYPMSCPKTESETNALDAKSPNSLTETSGLGTTVFSSSTTQSNGVQHNKLFSNNSNVFSQVGSPSDTTSSVSSFTTSGAQHMQLMSPESVDSVILTMSPVDARNGVIGLGSGVELNNAPTSNLSTFKTNGVAALCNKINGKNEHAVRPQRPKPPNTLNLDLRKPPAPPLRWSKPLSPKSPSDATANNNNFIVTTTVTFSVENTPPQFVEVSTPAAGNVITTNATTFQTFSKRLSPEGECKDTLSSQGSSSNGSRWHSHSSKDSNSSQKKILSPGSTGTPSGGSSGGKSRKSKARKESQHYQESNILESPLVCCHSTLIDKISDYEDLWTQDQNERTNLLTTFKPQQDGVQGKRPDLLAETPTITSLSANLLSPANSTLNSLSPASQNNDKQAATTPTSEQIKDNQQLIQFSSEAAPRSRNGLMLPGIMSQSYSEEHFKSDTNNEGDTTPTALTPVSRSKQGSPFYAEPADALRQAGINASILRRSGRGPLLPANHRHSEPPKGGLARNHLCPVLVPTEIEKIAGSLDELKKKQQQKEAQPQKEPSSKRARARLEQWQLDSSWEFMGKHDDEEDDNWKLQPQHTSHDKENMNMHEESDEEQKHKPLTVHQIIAKRLPDLNLPELVRCSTPPQQQNGGTQQQNGIKQQLNELLGHKTVDSENSCRLSSYDNVERNYFTTSYFNGMDSAQSDDGTVFSEPWDSSQWDSFMPTDDTTASDTIHLSRCRAVVSEDDTIIEELSTKESNQDTLKPKKSNGRQKVATILRNPSMRDREILCHPRNKVHIYGANGPGDSVRSYTLQLAQDASSTFARNIENFISCTKESREAAPQVVMRNMRQFMNGMKNYLVKHGEGKFQQEVEIARARLKSDEFLNLDAILETVMHKLVVLPLREHLYGMFVDYYTRTEDIQLLAQNVKYACGRCAADFGIRASVTPPSRYSLNMISNILLRLQEAELPLEKLDLFLSVITTIFEATGCPRGQQLGADDFLPILVYVVAKCGFVGAEIEAEFMWGLLQPTLLNGEPGYYLTALCSAVHVLKSFMASENESGSGSLDWRSSSLPACSSVLRVIIPDECNGSLQTRTLPVRPHTTTREVCRIIAHKARITNPQDYALFKLVDGEETLLSDLECPQDIRLAAKGKHCMLAYKRIDAKIAWPTAPQTN